MRAINSAFASASSGASTPRSANTLPLPTWYLFFPFFMRRPSLSPRQHRLHHADVCPFWHNYATSAQDRDLRARHEPIFAVVIVAPGERANVHLALHKETAHPAPPEARAATATIDDQARRLVREHVEPRP